MCSSDLASDFFFYGRIRPVEELRALVDGLTCQTVNRFLRDHPWNQPTTVTLGPDPLEVRLGDS